MFNDKDFRNLADYIGRPRRRRTPLDPFIRLKMQAEDLPRRALRLRDPLGKGRLWRPLRRCSTPLEDALGPGCNYSYAAAPSAEEPVKLWAASDFWGSRIIVHDLSRGQACAHDISKLFPQKRNWYRILMSLG